MFDVPIRLPHLIVLIYAAAWILALYEYKPELLRYHPRLLSLIEGLCLGMAWAAFLYGTKQDPLESLVWSALLTGSLWFAVVYYCRYRYIQASHAET